MSKKVIVDASAFLALIQEEKGSEVIKPLLKDAIMSTVNVAEVLTSLQKVEVSSEEGLEYISLLIDDVIDFDLEQAKESADLYPRVKHKGLSLGDRACLTLGRKYKSPIYTADKAWKDIDQNLEIHLIR